MYAEQSYERDMRDEIFRNYMADCVRAMVRAENRYYDLVSGGVQPMAEDFDAEEMVDRIIERAGLEVRQHESSRSSSEGISR